MFEFLKTKFKRTVVIKGNHDNYLFIHGDVIPEQKDLEKADVVIMGHEHPAIALFDEVGAKEKIKAFLSRGFYSKSTF